MAEILSVISLISYILAGICFVLAVFFWFRFDIPSVIGDLSGRTAKKSIAKMRANNDKAGKTGKATYRSGESKIERDKISDSKFIFGKTQNKQNDDIVETGLLSENKIDFVETQETSLLDNDETGLLVDDNDTMLLSDNKKVCTRSGSKKIQLLEKVIFIHTDEVIEF